MKLPLECEAKYYRDFLSHEESSALFNWMCENIENIETNVIELVDGTVYTLDTGKWMFVDPELTSFSMLHEAHGRRMVWPPIVRELKNKIEQLTGAEFGVCVGIYYRSGEVGVSYHADLPAFGSTTLIPSVSLGQVREFRFRKKDDHADEFCIELEDGSLIIMGAGCQEMYEHSVPISPKYRNPRINLTFRRFGWPQHIQRKKGSS